MKTLKSICSFFALVLIVGSIGAQTFMECPEVALKDTAYVRTRITRDIYFNPENSPLLGRRFVGPVDLDIKVSCLTATDTATVEVYGIKRKRITGSTTLETVALDSHRVAQIPLTATATWYTYAIDPLWTYFPNFDGLRIVIKQGGSDDDDDTFYENLRVWPQGNVR